MKSILFAIIAITALAQNSQAGVYEGKVKALSGNKYSWYCAIDDIDLLHCWGENAPQVPTKLGPMKAVTVGQHVCVIKNDDSVSCFGEADMADGGIFVPGEMQFAKSISASTVGDSTCGIDLQGKAFCWRVIAIDDEFEYRVTPLPYTYDDFEEVSTGVTAACFVDSTGRAACWNPDYSWGMIQAPANDVVKISFDDWATACALMKNGEIKCFGVNYDYVFDPSSQPQPIPSNLGIAKDISLARVNACAINESSQIQCWTMCGAPGCSSTGIGTPFSDRVIKVVNGKENGCAILEDHHVKCWGKR